MFVYAHYVRMFPLVQAWAADEGPKDAKVRPEIMISITLPGWIYDTKHLIFPAFNPTANRPTDPPSTQVQVPTSRQSLGQPPPPRIRAYTRIHAHTIITIHRAPNSPTHSDTQYAITHPCTRASINPTQTPIYSSYQSR